MSALLAAVKRASSKRAAAEQRYRQAIRDAREAGHTMPEIGQAAGLTKQGVQYLLHPYSRKRETT